MANGHRKKIFMWIKSLSSDVWVNITHITHFKIHPVNHTLHDVVAYLDASMTGLDSRQHEVIDGQAFVTVKRGTYEECEEFVKEQTFLQTAYQWIGYLVAGGIGAVLTLWFKGC